MSRARKERRRLQRQERRRLERQVRKLLPMDRQFVLVGNDEIAVNVPDTGSIFFSQPAELGGVLVVEAVAYSGPGVAERKAVLEAELRDAGFGAAIDESKRRKEMAS